LTVAPGDADSARLDGLLDRVPPDEVCSADYEQLHAVTHMPL